ncbi:MAG: putative porin, partial [Chitinophagaceae bacterium]
MKLKVIVAACALVASGVAVADSYKAEVGAKVYRTDLDGLPNQFSTYNVDGKYYFNDVQTDNLPLAETAYIGKNSNIFANASHIPKKPYLVSGEFYNVGVEFYIPESFFYVAGGISRHNADIGKDDNDWFTSIGVTPIDGLLIATDYYHDAGYDANVRAKYVTAIGSNHFINIEAKVADTDGYTHKEIGGDFYFDNTFSLGGSIADIGSDNQYTVRSRKFFTERFSGEVSYTDFGFGNQLMAGVD